MHLFVCLHISLWSMEFMHLCLCVPCFCLSIDVCISLCVRVHGRGACVCVSVFHARAPISAQRNCWSQLKWEKLNRGFYVAKLNRDFYGVLQLFVLTYFISMVPMKITVVTVTSHILPQVFVGSS